MVAKSFPTSPRPLASKAFVWGGCLWRVSYCANPVLSPSLLLAVPNCRQMDAPDTISDFLDTFTSVMSIMPLKLHKKHQWRIDSNSDLFPVELWALLSTKNWNRKFQIEVNSGNREFLSIVGGKPLARPVGTLTSHILNVSYSNTLLASTIRLITVQCVATIDPLFHIFTQPTEPAPGSPKRWFGQYPKYAKDRNGDGDEAMTMMQNSWVQCIARSNIMLNDVADTKEAKEASQTLPNLASTSTAAAAAALIQYL